MLFTDFRTKLLFMTRLEKLTNDKHHSLVLKSINHGQNKVTLGPGT